MTASTCGSVAPGPSLRARFPYAARHCLDRAICADRHACDTPFAFY